MPVFIFLGVLLIAAGAAAQYAVCRWPKRKLWRYVPPAVTFLVAAAVFAARYFGWSAEHGGETAPLETLLFIPILPAALVFAGLYLGWRVWKWRWLPRVVRDKKGG